MRSWSLTRKSRPSTIRGPGRRDRLRPDALGARQAREHTRRTGHPDATCWQCHGSNGDGNGPVAAFLGDAKPRDFTSATFVIDGHEDEIATFIALGAARAAHGSRYMPEWASRLSPQQIRDTVAYLRTFKKPPH